MAQRNLRINRQIRVKKVRLIDAKGEQAGIVSIQDAQKRADEANLDLVEVQPNVDPPVCRILDYGKLKYEQKKKDRGGAVKKGASQLKELRVRPTIDPHDLEYRLKKGREFIEAGHKVQVVCVFRGRQMEHPEHGYNVMKQVADMLSDVAKIESQAKMMGRRMTMLLSPLPQKPGAKSGGGDKPAGEAPAPRAATPVDPPKAPRPEG